MSSITELPKVPLEIHLEKLEGFIIAFHNKFKYVFDFKSDINKLHNHYTTLKSHIVKLSELEAAYRYDEIVYPNLLQLKDILHSLCTTARWLYSMNIPSAKTYFLSYEEAKKKHLTIRPVAKIIKENILDERAIDYINYIVWDYLPKVLKDIANTSFVFESIYNNISIIMQQVDNFNTIYQCNVSNIKYELRNTHYDKFDSRKNQLLSKLRDVLNDLEEFYPFLFGLLSKSKYSINENCMMEIECWLECLYSYTCKDIETALQITRELKGDYYGN